MLKRIHIEGFKSIKSLGDQGLELTRLNVVIGPNGAGKSNLIAAFKLLGLMLDGRLQEYVGKQGGAARVLHHGPKVSSKIKMQFDFDRNGYSFSLSPTVDDRFTFSSEQTHFQGDLNPEIASSIGAGHSESKLPAVVKWRLPKKGIPAYVMEGISNWIVFHFHDTSDLAPPKQTQSTSDNRSLRADAGNLASFLFRLQSTDQKSYGRIVESIRQIAPFFDDFRLAPMATRPSDIKLEWRQKGSDAYFDGASLSDGTLRFICLATLLLQPRSLMPSLILIDEPELGLHPAALTHLAELIHAASKQQQILLATQSPTLLDHFQAKDIIVAEQHEGASVFKRLDIDALSSWIEEYALGELWLKNELGGRP
jgi:predicted ATPase